MENRNFWQLCGDAYVPVLWSYVESRNSSLDRGTRDVSPATSRRFPMVLGDTEGATLSRISSLDAVWAAKPSRTMHRSWCASILHGRPEPGLWVWEYSTDNSAESSDTPPIHCALHVQQSVNVSIQLPAYLQCDPVKMAVVVQQEYVLVGWTWLYRRVNVANTVHLSKHHNYCLQNQNRGCNDKTSWVPSDRQWLCGMNH